MTWNDHNSKRILNIIWSQITKCWNKHKMFSTNLSERVTTLCTIARSNNYMHITIPCIDHQFWWHLCIFFWFCQRITHLTVLLDGGTKNEEWATLTLTLAGAGPMYGLHRRRIRKWCRREDAQLRGRNARLLVWVPFYRQVISSARCPVCE